MLYPPVVQLHWKCTTPQSLWFIYRCGTPGLNKVSINQTWRALQLHSVKNKWDFCEAKQASSKLNSPCIKSCERHTDSNLSRCNTNKIRQDLKTLHQFHTVLQWQTFRSMKVITEELTCASVTSPTALFSQLSSTTESGAAAERLFVFTSKRYIRSATNHMTKALYVETKWGIVLPDILAQLQWNYNI